MITKYHKVCGLEQQKFMVHSPEGQSLKSRCQQAHASSKYKILPCLFLGSWWQLSVLGIPWLTATTLQSPPVLNMASSLCICVYTWTWHPPYVSVSTHGHPSFYKSTNHIGLWIHSTLVELQLNDTCNNTISK